jgi:hypothetical protein
VDQILDAVDLAMRVPLMSRPALAIGWFACIPIAAALIRRTLDQLPKFRKWAYNRPQRTLMSSEPRLRPRFVRVGAGLALWACILRWGVSPWLSSTMLELVPRVRLHVTFDVTY